MKGGIEAGLNGNRLQNMQKIMGIMLASRKFFAIKDGKKIYLSRKHIEQKIKKVD